MKDVQSNKTTIPALGFGTWQLKGDDAKKLVSKALEVGYRHIDTAQVYENEEAVGKGIKQSGKGRDDFFLTTKVWFENFADNFADSVHSSLKKLQVDAVDLLLIHWPHPDLPLANYMEKLVEVQQKDMTKHIGVSNFTPELMREAAKLAPNIVTNQVEYHPFLDQSKVIQTAHELGWSVTAYSPIAQGEVLEDDVLDKIAEKHGKNEVQIALRWLLQQKGVIAIPRTSSEAHVADNFDIFDFELSDNEMQEIFALNAQNKKIVDPEFAPDWSY